ncbi:MAG TPA: ribosome biogenesis factor YjgA [Steroidobacteraceae bacterium]|nr:ribosome biogenesis factor YjgA [Steroidobacteraceae bacterium]
MSDDPGDDEGADRPSKSARKRAAHAAQELGEQLVRLPEAQLAALALPEPLAEAIRAARHIGSRAAAARQRQYIGKLMRAVDLAPLHAALSAQSARAAAESERFRRVENWRERLLAEGAPALAELKRWYPQIDAAEWTGRIQAARRERARGAGGAAARELFRALRTLFATMPR